MEIGTSAFHRWMLWDIIYHTDLIAEYENALTVQEIEKWVVKLIFLKNKMHFRAISIINLVCKTLKSFPALKLSVKLMKCKTFRLIFICQMAEAKYAFFRFDFRI